ncbi:MAG: flagellar hook-associated protein FlgK [Phycisphaerales bacterium]|nr:MAG: flagellar hook-associated protein FlgK [Phycisphaerales bacterium]
MQMSLGAALNIGRSALTASQLGIQVAGNNMANVASPHYTRGRLELAPIAGSSGSGLYMGRGVQVQGLTREVNEAVVQRLRTGISDASGARAKLDVYGAVEARLNELSGDDLSSQLTAFFNSWSERANLVQSSAVVIQQGQQLAGYIQGLRKSLVDQRLQVDAELGAMVERADVLLQQVAALNAEIVSAEEGRFTAGPLRDQRDAVLAELSELIDISTIEQSGGGVDVMVGSTPVVLGGMSRGITLERESVGGRVEMWVSAKNDGTRLPVTSGRVGGLLETRRDAVNGTLDRLDEISTQLIYQVNRVTAEAAGEPGLTRASGTVPMAAGDRVLALSDPQNASVGGMAVPPTNGSFLVQVRDTSTGGVRTVRVDVDMNGIDANGNRSFADDTSAEDIRVSIGAIDGLSATFDASGRLVIESEPGIEFAFAEDSSGVLAAMGVNAFFTGTDARDISVRQDLVDNPTLLKVGRSDASGLLVENGGALAVAKIQDLRLEALGGDTIRGRWSSTVQEVANRTTTAKVQAESTSIVQQSLQAQRDGLSGVSLDEETLNLMMFQRQFQGASRLIAVTDELMQTLINLV